MRASGTYTGNVVFCTKTAEGALWIVPQIEAARRRGYRVVVITPSGAGRLRDELARMIRDDPGISHEDVRFDFSFKRFSPTCRGLHELRRIVRRTRPIVVFSHLYAATLAMRLATLFLPVRRVSMVAGPLYLESKIVNTAERILHRMDDVIIAGSEYTARRYTRLGVPSKRLRTIYFGVDLDRFSKVKAPAREQARSDLGLSNESFVVVMVALVYAPKSLVFPGEGLKGHRYLLQAWRDFVRTHPESQLLLVGGGFGPEGVEHREELKLANSDLLNDRSVVWFDTMSDVRIAYAAADVSVSPSLSENHGAAVEASAMSVPSIVSSAGGLPETVTQGSGWTFKAASCTDLLRGLENAHAARARGELTAMGANARKHCEARWDLRVQAELTVDAVLSVAPTEVQRPQNRKHSNQ